MNLAADQREQKKKSKLEDTATEITQPEKYRGEMKRASVTCIIILNNLIYVFNITI